MVEDRAVFKLRLAFGCEIDLDAVQARFSKTKGALLGGLRSGALEDAVAEHLLARRLRPPRVEDLLPSEAAWIPCVS